MNLIYIVDERYYVLNLTSSTKYTTGSIPIIIHISIKLKFYNISSKESLRNIRLKVVS